MKKYFVLAAVAVFALAQTAMAQRGGTTTTTTTTTTTKEVKTKGPKGDKGKKGGKEGKEKKGWAEMKTFHHFMSTTFHPAENGDFAPLRAKADSLYLSAVSWQLSPIPANFKEKETKDALTKLVGETKAIAAAVKANTADAELLKMITEAHETFHKVMGECRKEEEHKEGDDHKVGEERKEK